MKSSSKIFVILVKHRFIYTKQLDKYKNTDVPVLIYVLKLYSIVYYCVEKYRCNLD